MFRQLHDRRQRNALVTRLRHEPRPETVTTKIPLQRGKARTPLHDLADRGPGTGQGPRAASTAAGNRLYPKNQGVKNAPAALGKLAGQWWALALVHARDAVLAEFSEVRQDIALKQEELLVRSQALAGEMSAAHARSEAALAAERLACARTTELQRLVDQLQLQAAELAGQRTAAIQRLEQVEASRQVLYDRLQETEESARSERESLAEHVRSVENRALGDLDHARQESKTLQTQLSSAVRRHASIDTEMRHSLEKAHSATAAAVQMTDLLGTHGRTSIRNNDKPPGSELKK